MQPFLPRTPGRAAGLVLLAIVAAQVPVWLILPWRQLAAVNLCLLCATLALEAVFAVGIVRSVRRHIDDLHRDRLTSSEEASRVSEAATQRAHAISDWRQRVEGAFATLHGGVDERHDDVMRSTKTLHTTADELARAAMRVISETTVASVAAEDVRRELGVVVATGHEFLETIARIGDHAASSATMGVEAFRRAEATRTNVDELLVASQRIGEMTALVASIARQTNLLALNATIEAARAGEHGRGFAVVAAEVKSLANESARAAASIAEMAGTIYGSTERTIGSIRAISETIRGLNEATTAIAGAVEERVRAAASMTGDVGQVAANIDHVASSIGRIETAVDETVQGTSFIRVSASEVATQMTAIQDHFRRCSGALIAVAWPEPIPA